MTVSLAAFSQEEISARKWRGMNPAFVRRVWAKRRELVRAEPAPTTAPTPKKTIGQILAERAVERERALEAARIERLKRKMEAGGVQAIIAEVAMAHGVTVADILGPLRSKHIVKARHEAIIEVAIRRPAFSTTQIGKCFSRDHTTILFVLQKYGIRQPSISAGR